MPLLTGALLLASCAATSSAPISTESGRNPQRVGITCSSRTVDGAKDLGEVLAELDWETAPFALTSTPVCPSQP